MVGSLPNLYESIEKLDQYSFIRPNVSKDKILRPVPPLSGYSVPIFSLKEPPTPAKKSYTCYSCKVSDYFSDSYNNANCPTCRGGMSRSLCYIAPPVAVQQESESRRCEGGFVKESVTYMVMDDLGVKPMSSISSITNLLNQFNIKNVCTLEEKKVDIGKNEAVKLLKASFVTKMVLTNVFLYDANKEST